MFFSLSLFRSLSLSLSLSFSLSRMFVHHSIIRLIWHIFCWWHFCSHCVCVWLWLSAIDYKAHTWFFFFFLFVVNVGVNHFNTHSLMTISPWSNVLNSFALAHIFQFALNRLMKFDYNVVSPAKTKRKKKQTNSNQRKSFLFFRSSYSG